ncbi:myb-like protein X [Micropterus salmoides]|uniref:myb-like protein X n=1 Tax=Micropterus salmoides TaxID=27706 RepID=UPI0018ED919A|nr:myb-like protein X [Micropterus salmoides]
MNYIDVVWFLHRKMFDQMATSQREHEDELQQDNNISSYPAEETETDKPKWSREESDQEEEEGDGEEEESDQEEEEGDGEEEESDQEEEEGDGEEEESDQEEEEGDGEEEESDQEEEEGDGEEEESDQEESQKWEDKDKNQEIFEKIKDLEARQGTSESAIRVGLINVSSLNKKKTPRIKALIETNKLHALLTTETHLKSENAKDVLKKATPENYRFCYQCRDGGRGAGPTGEEQKDGGVGMQEGGGVAIQFLNNEECHPIHFDVDIEHVGAKLTFGGREVMIICVYRPPSNGCKKFLKQTEKDFKNFLKEMGLDSQSSQDEKDKNSENVLTERDKKVRTFLEDKCTEINNCLNPVRKFQKKIQEDIEKFLEEMGLDSQSSQDEKDKNSENVLTEKEKKVRTFLKDKCTEVQKCFNPVGKFLKKFEELVNCVSNTHKDQSIIIAGDFNFQVNKDDNKDANHFKELLKNVELNLESNRTDNPVWEATHEKGNTLDLVITKNVKINYHFVHKPDPVPKLSDHYTIFFSAGLK